MAKYKLGDAFIATITDVNDTGMGVTYELDERAVVAETDLDSLTLFKPSSLPVDERKEDKPREYTLEELKERIFVLSDLLHRATTAYRESVSKVKDSIDAVDRLERD